MNPELAKKLGRAGFPLKTSFLDDEMNGFIKYAGGNRWHFQEPTLSELIEACGAKFTHLQKFTEAEHNPEWVKEEGLWHAEWEKGVTTMECASGHTPEEAVANLWLKLKTLNA